MKWGSVKAVLLQPEGKVVIGGNFQEVNGLAYRALARLHPDGRFDESFDTRAFAQRCDLREVRALVLQSNGRLLVGAAEMSPNLGCIFGCSSNGSWDWTFGTSLAMSCAQVRSIVLQPDGKSLVSGIIDNIYFLSRLNHDGTWDETFSPPLLGVSYECTLQAFAVQSDGKIVVGEAPSVGQNAAPHLHTVHKAVWQDRCLQVRLRRWSVEVERGLQPYGLVAKAGEWYLVYAGQGRLRVERVAEFLDARLLEQSFQRSMDFDLPAFWQAWCARQESLRTGYRVLLRVRSDFVPALAARLGPHVGERLQPPQSHGSRLLEWEFASLEAARGRLLAMGSGVEVLEPLALRRSLLDYAEQVVEVYRVAGATNQV